ncbi:uncharacterized protein MELLADRAFT_111047 [Melampsora larici-populina 98AG31]|uniref:Uncharacterized protein n=1 Tax=Melampsora larici-populina (strain 98AG31 / pathotype 3-4-7) TaxID=747676 RepID=F4S1V5_MELLP|nr:uncharacterized protein MELLADRAFT_111047 [Melampsora larici-populina 98AG31]EGG01257.1 hypothetical protein MELLADRAFT_111047 [Melampsora larici-populina 98AG31]
MTMAMSSISKAIRASKRVRGMEVSPMEGDDEEGNQVNEQEADGNEDKGKKRQEVSRARIESQTTENDQVPLASTSENRLNPSFIAHVPIPFPAPPNPNLSAPLPREGTTQSSSDIDDLPDNFRDDESQEKGSTISEASDIGRDRKINSSSSSHDSSKETDQGYDSDSSSSSNSNDSDSDTSSSSSESESEDSNDSGSSEDQRKKEKKRKRSKKLEKELMKAKEKIKELENPSKGKSSSKKKKDSKKDSKRAQKKKKSSKKKGIQVDIGVIPESNLIQLQPFWRKQMKKLESSIPLTVFDQGFARADKEEYEKQHHSSSSKTSKNKGLNAPSKFKMTYGEWTENISLFKRYLIQHNQSEVAKRLKYHIKNVKQVKRLTECWMTALRYDILCRRHIFVERIEKEPIKDIGTFMKRYEDKAKDKSLSFGEANGGETNPYTKGGKLEFKHPETGQMFQTNQGGTSNPQIHQTNTSGTGPPATSFQSRGNRGVWRGGRGGIGRGTGRQGQNET